MHNIMGEEIIISKEDSYYVNQLMHQFFENDNDFYNNVLMTKLSKEKSIELMLSFFKTVSNDLYDYVKKIITNKSTFKFIYEPFNYNELDSKYNDAYVALNLNEICVPLRDDLRDLYSLVHELTHTFDIKNGDNSTRRIYGEVAPQCMERLLDKFLLNLNERELEYYGFDKEILKEDIKKREITTFLSRIGNFNSVIMKRRNEKSIRYVISQLYSIILVNLDFDTSKKIILDFIKSVEKNNIYLFFSKYNFNYTIQNLIDLNLSRIKELNSKEMIK